MSKIRLGIIGTGLAFTELHLQELTRLSDKFEIRYLANRTRQKAEDVADQIGTMLNYKPEICANAEELLLKNDLDAVDIAVPIHITAKYVDLAIKNKLHIFAEKPVADDLSNGIRLVRRARSNKLVLAVGENFRYQNKFKFAFKIIQDGLIGKPILYRLNDLHYTHPESKYAATQWRKDGKHQGGYLIDGGSHIIAGMRVMVGSRVEKLHGMTASFNPELLGKQDDTLLFHLYYENGLSGQMALGYGAVDPDARKPKVYGEDGTLVLMKDRIEVWPVDTKKEMKSFTIENNNSGYYEEWLDFYNAITSGKPLSSTPEDSLVDLQIILKGIESARTDKVIELENI